MKTLVSSASKIFFSLAFIVPASMAWGQSLTVLNAASQQAVHIAPGSIITIFGTNLTTGTAVTPSALTPPTALGGVTVTIGGAAAALFYTSPGQINAVVDPATSVGTDPVVVKSSTGTQNGSVVIDANSPPGLFALNGIGTGDGAFVNALTALLAPFTPGSNNSATYLELYATGLNLSVAPVVSIGGVPGNVLFYGPSPCCVGLQQINIAVPASLAGAGRVPVIVTDNGQASNTVQVVLLPSGANKEFPGDDDNRRRNRELAELAYVPGTSLVLSTDENDDVVRIVDISAHNVTQVISLSTGAAPDGIAVNDTGTLALVAERGLGQVAIVDLTAGTLVAEIPTGTGAAPVSVAIAGKLGIVVNRDTDNVSIVDLTAGTIANTIAVGHAPSAVAVDAKAGAAYVTNEDDGTLSVIDLTSLAVTNTITIGASARLEAVAVAEAGIAFVTAPASGEVFLVDIVKGLATPISVNPSGSAGAAAVAVFNSTIYFANQADGSISALPIDPVTGAEAGPLTTIRVDEGARALAIDTADNLLVVSNEGTGTLVLVDLTSGKVVGRIKAVKSDLPGDDGGDDHSDHHAAGDH